MMLLKDSTFYGPNLIFTFKRINNLCLNNIDMVVMLFNNETSYKFYWFYYLKIILIVTFHLSNEVYA